MTWTDARVETLKKLWCDGVTASAIAEAIGEVTRNAVIGKVHRLGLAGRATTSRKRPVSRPASHFPAPSPSRKSRSQPRVHPAWRPLVTTMPRRSLILPELGASPVEPVTVANLTERSCRWPLGDPMRPDFHFCGRSKPAARSYCDHHAAIAYR
jgi:GcrA cell cycle regulator